MDEPQEQKMTPFDQTISDDTLQLLKASIPYAPAKIQGFLSVLVKMKELETVISLTRKKSSIQMMSKEGPDFSLTDMLSDIGRYTSGTMKEIFDKISQAMTMFEMFQSFQDMDFSNMDFSNMDFSNMDFSNMDMSNMGFKNMFHGSDEEDDEKSTEENSDKPINPPPVNESDIKQQEQEVDDLIDSLINHPKEEKTDNNPSEA
ncbi:pentapeptide repeat-containing protein [Blautia liquoris]|uniref:Pentapeptide repeat-containing protein n=1 Tax=Blautia liquoris TaxID=2779518 RepID=A0A7M2RM54_9FIRM|nr:pentapeptide repeat-containing protein [Blautia liquoris]QOV20627.1 pentapeptide repeat-containing protein [Blautia liquoris]